MTMTYEFPPMRPPSEAYSLLIRAMRGCSWNKCTFCDAYKDIQFEGKKSMRPVDDVKGDIDTLKHIAERAGEPDLVAYGIDVNMFPWLLRYGSNPQTAFFTDSNAIVMKTDDLSEMVSYLRETFPSVTRVTSYGRAKTVVMKKPGEMERLRQAGLTRLHLGLESGDDAVLAFVKKGATTDEMIEAGIKTKEAGFELSQYVMPGLGGRALSEQHATETARVLNAVDPHYARMRPLNVRPGTPLHEAYESMDFQVLTPYELLQEMRIMVERLDVTGRICFDHVLNPHYRDKEVDGVFPVFSQDYEGYKFPEEKGEVLAIIDHVLETGEIRYMGTSPPGVRL